MQQGQTPIGVDSFWLEADAEDCSDHPLERELCYRLDAVARYLQLIDEAEAIGRDDMVDSLLAQHDRQAEMVIALREALRRTSSRSQI